MHSSLGTLHIFGSNILGGNGGHGGDHSRWHDKYETDEFLHNADGGSVNKSALIGYHGNGEKRNLLSMLKSKCFDHYFHFKLRFNIQG